MSTLPTPDLPVDPQRPDEINQRCPECDYNLTGAIERCPWCGWDIDLEVLDAAAQRRGGRRIAVVIVALTAAAATIAAAFFLFHFGRGLRWRDAAALVAVTLGAGGHLTLAATALRQQSVWPLRRGEISAILLVMSLISISAGATGATQALALAPTPLFSPTGVQVNGIFEFALTAVFFSLPGLSLLALRLVSFRPRRKVAPPPTGRGRNSSAEERATFLVQWIGHAAREQVDMSYAEQPRPTTPEVERLIAETWDSVEEQARTENRMLFNGPLIRLVHFTHQQNHLRLDVGPTCYRDFVGTHFHNAGLIRATAPDSFAQALGISALPVTRDGQLVLGRRSPRVAWHGGWLHPFGGMVEPSDRCTAGHIDVFGSARRELCEELRIASDHVSAMALIALVRDADLWQPELIFDAALAQSGRELLKSFDHRQGDGEHDALHFVSDDPESIAAFLREQLRLTPVGQAALLTHGRRHFGVEWYDQTCLILYGTVPDGVKSSTT